jgi:nucleoside-diphosphate-sugar epimerase
MERQKFNPLENPKKPSTDSLPKRYAVTGAGGFIGSRLVSYLRSYGHEVLATVREQSANETLRSAGADVRVADVTDMSQLVDAFNGADGVFHLAALFNHPDKSWEDYRAVNVEGTLNVLRAAQEAGCQRVVHCSTVGVATEAHPPPYNEDTPYSPQPDDKYEVTKTEGEIAARQFAGENEISLAVIRPAQVYGPGDKSKSKFYKLVKKGVIVRPGKTKKHLIYIDDLCDAFLRAMTTEAADGEVFLIAGRQSTPLEELVTLAAFELGVPVPRIRLPAMPVVLACTVVEKICNLIGIKPFIFKRSMDFFTKSIECDTTKSQRLLGISNQMSVDDGVKNTVAWLQSQVLI